MKRGGTIIHQTVLNANARASADNRFLWRWHELADLSQSPIIIYLCVSAFKWGGRVILLEIAGYYAFRSQQKAYDYT